MRIGVLGAGVMGSGIAQVMAVAGHDVVCHDISPSVLDTARKDVDTGRFGVRSAVARGKLTTETSDETVVRLAHEAGKNPIVIEDAPMAWGYVANRVYGAMLREATRVAEEGIASRQEMDAIMVDCFRWPTEPFGMTRGAVSGWR